MAAPVNTFKKAIEGGRLQAGGRARQSLCGRDCSESRFLGCGGARKRNDQASRRIRQGRCEPDVQHRVVYHGLPRDLLPFSENPKGDYVAFLGRISLEKRPDRTIRIAACAGVKLKIAAKIDRADEIY